MVILIVARNGILDRVNTYKDDQEEWVIETAEQLIASGEARFSFLHDAVVVLNNESILWCRGCVSKDLLKDTCI